MADFSPNPGSYNDFVQVNGLEQGPQAIATYGEAATKYREGLATSLGMDLGELHTTSLSVLSERATQLVLAQV